MRPCAERGLPLLLLFALAACGDPSPAEPRPEPLERRAAHPAPSEPSPRAGPSEAPSAASAKGRIVAIEGTGASLGARAATVGDAWGLEETLTTGEATVTADLPNGARLVFFPDTQAVRTDLGGEAVALGLGQVQAILGAEGNSRRTPLRLATPAGELASATSLEAVVTVSAGGRAAAAVLAGFGELSLGERSPEGRPLRLPLPAGRRIAFGDAASEPLPPRVDAAAARRASMPPRRGPTPPAALGSVAPALEALEGLERRQQALDASLLGRSSPGAPDVSGDQRERVRIAQELTRAEETLAVLVHRLVAASLVDPAARARLDADRPRLSAASRPGTSGNPRPGIRD